jgi:hypothetical protein
MRGARLFRGGLPGRVILRQFTVACINRGKAAMQLPLVRAQ